MADDPLKFPPVPSEHVILLKEGQLNYGANHDESTTTAQFEAVFSAFAAAASQQGRTKLILDFHGGLVDEEEARKWSRPCFHYYNQANAYPVFLMWDSDIKSQFERNAWQFFADAGFQMLSGQLLKFLKGKFGSGAAGGTPESLTESALQRERRIAPETIPTDLLKAEVDRLLPEAELAAFREAVVRELSKAPDTPEATLQLEATPEHVAEGAPADPGAGSRERALALVANSIRSSEGTSTVWCS